MEEYFIANEIEGGYTWTLTSRLGQALREAEMLFGTRDKSWTILGVEFNRHDQPQIWFPGNCGNIIIQLCESSLGNLGSILFQLSHEVIHCLSPVGTAQANVLEEGLATFFSIKYVEKHLGQIIDPGRVEYKNALFLVNRLLSIDQGIIKRIRKVQPIISAISVDDLVRANRAVSLELAEQLCKPFR